MKRALFFMLLFVNLQIAVTRSGITVGVATASAQTMMYEELPGVEVVGNLYDCKWGGAASTWPRTCWKHTRARVL